MTRDSSARRDEAQRPAGALEPCPWKSAGRRGKTSNQLPCSHQLVHLGAGGSGRAAVVDDGVGPLLLQLARHLDGLPVGQVGVRPAALAADAGQADRPRGVHEDQLVARPVPPGLEHDGRVEDDEPGGGVHLGLVDLLPDPPLDVRVDQVFQAAALDGTREDDAAELLAVDNALEGEDVAGAPDVDHLGPDVRVFEGLVPERVGGDNLAAVPGEGVGDGTLAGADAADEAEDGLAVGSRGHFGTTFPWRTFLSFLTAQSPVPAFGGHRGSPSPTMEGGGSIGVRNWLQMPYRPRLPIPSPPRALIPPRQTVPSDSDKQPTGAPLTTICDSVPAALRAPLSRRG